MPCLCESVCKMCRHGVQIDADNKVMVIGRGRSPNNHVGHVAGVEHACGCIVGFCINSKRFNLPSWLSVCYLETFVIVIGKFPNVPHD